MTKGSNSPSNMCSIMRAPRARCLAQNVTRAIGAATFLWITCVGATQAPPAPTATVSGVVTWLYNNYTGHRGDEGADVYLFRLPVKKPISSEDIAQRNKFDSIPGTQKQLADGFGNVEFDDVPRGHYLVLIVSRNVARNPNEPLDPSFKAAIRPLFASDALAEVAAGPLWPIDENPMPSVPPDETILGLKSATALYLDVKGERAHFSYDFGVTYI